MSDLDSVSALSSIFSMPTAFLMLLYCSICAGMKTTVSEAEHPLLCEGTRRVKGDLALALMITYKDDQTKLKKVKSGSSQLAVRTCCLIILEVICVSSHSGQTGRW